MYCCDVCGIENENVFYFDGQYLCQDCFINNKASYKVLNYSFKKPPYFYKLENETTKKYFGFELEISNNNYVGYDFLNTTAEEIRSQLNGLVYSKTDGSVSDGLEIVSEPMTFNYLKSIKYKLDNLFDYLMQENFTSDESKKCSCGLHFHISKNCLGETTEEIENNINLIWLVLENFKNELFKFSRRKTRDLTRWGKFLSDKVNANDLEYIKTLKFIGDNKQLQTNERYLALNILNKNTIEFRFIKGTLNIKTFYASLELLNNIIDLVLNCKGDVKKLIGKSFKDLILLNNSEYLFSYCQKRNIKLTTKIDDLSKQLEKLQRIAKRNLLLKFNKQCLQEKRKFMNNFSVNKIWNDMQDINNCIYRLLNIYRIDFVEIIGEEKKEQLKNIRTKINKLENDFFYDKTIIKKDFLINCKNIKQELKMIFTNVNFSEIEKKTKTIVKIRIKNYLENNNIDLRNNNDYIINSFVSEYKDLYFKLYELKKLGGVK